MFEMSTLIYVFYKSPVGTEPISLTHHGLMDTFPTNSCEFPLMYPGIINCCFHPQ